jgi:L-ascorbate metabolism protein UlaG (beta-lactamase superfamily)
VFPISHATTIVEWGDTTMYIDPAEPSDSYEGFNAPDMIFITHIHGDHLQQEVLEEIYESGVAVIVPNSVNSELNEQLQEYTIVMETETIREVGDFNITAVPAYNIREEALNYHPQDRADNGYIIEKEGLRIYFS